MTKLSVNINKIATLRNARGGDIPNVVKAAQDIERFGADGITVHPRPDERHIRYQDVFDLKQVVRTEFNVEGYPNESFMDLVLAVKPEQVTLVPDPPGVLTSNAGWDTITHKDLLHDVITTLNKAGIRTSIFIECDQRLIEGAAALGSSRIELYTESYARGFVEDKNAAIAPYKKAAQWAVECGLGVNAGHDLNASNLAFFASSLIQLDEVSIGHALISEALYLGLENTVQAYQFALGK
ncbi:MAG: pyridoxine 5'-phosphate synthase [Flavobacteriales bacterium]|nr:pyridoxine 5'-phosphate synthase [Flavobacteriales bacterium]MDG1767354.1 pyridoxine 5'-phosphate synthase [Flavobacteriales bacterium]